MPPRTQLTAHAEDYQPNDSINKRRTELPPAIAPAAMKSIKWDISRWRGRGGGRGGYRGRGRGSTVVVNQRDINDRGVVAPGQKGPMDGAYAARLSAAPVQTSNMNALATTSHLSGNAGGVNASLRQNQNQHRSKDFTEIPTPRAPRSHEARSIYAFPSPSRKLVQLDRDRHESPYKRRRIDDGPTFDGAGALQLCSERGTLRPPSLPYPSGSAVPAGLGAALERYPSPPPIELCSGSSRAHPKRVRDPDPSSSHYSHQDPVPKPSHRPSSPPSGGRSSSASGSLIKPEPRSPSPKAPPPPILVMSGCTFYPNYPIGCVKSQPNFRKNRRAWAAKEARLLRDLGLGIEVDPKLLFRDDGMVLEWKSTKPISLYDLPKMIEAAHLRHPDPPAPEIPKSSKKKKKRKHPPMEDSTSQLSLPTTSGATAAEAIDVDEDPEPKDLIPPLSPPRGRASEWAQDIADDANRDGGLNDHPRHPAEHRLLEEAPPNFMEPNFTSSSTTEPALASSSTLDSTRLPPCPPLHPPPQAPSSTSTPTHPSSLTTIPPQSTPSRASTPSLSRTPDIHHRDDLRSLQADDSGPAGQGSPTLNATASSPFHISRAVPAIATLADATEMASSPYRAGSVGDLEEEQEHEEEVDELEDDWELVVERDDDMVQRQWKKITPPPEIAPADLTESAPPEPSSIPEDARLPERRCEVGEDDNARHLSPPRDSHDTEAASKSQRVPPHPASVEAPEDAHLDKGHREVDDDADLFPPPRDTTEVLSKSRRISSPPTSTSVASVPASSRPIGRGINKELEQLAENYVIAYLDMFDLDRNRLANAYAKDATLSCRRHQRKCKCTSTPSKPSSSTATCCLDNFAPPSQSTWLRRDSGFSIRQGHLAILQELLLLGPHSYGIGLRGESALQCDMIQPCLGEGNEDAYVVVTCYLRVGLDSTGDDGGRRELVGVDNVWMLRRRDGGDPWFRYDGPEEEDWPLVAVSHQMVIREILEGDVLEKTS